MPLLRMQPIATTQPIATMEPHQSLHNKMRLVNSTRNPRMLFNPTELSPVWTWYPHIRRGMRVMKCIPPHLPQTHTRQLPCASQLTRVCFLQVRTQNQREQGKLKFPSRASHRNRRRRLRRRPLKVQLRLPHKSPLVPAPPRKPRS